MPLSWSWNRMLAPRKSHIFLLTKLGRFFIVQSRQAAICCQVWKGGSDPWLHILDTSEELLNHQCWVPLRPLKLGTLWAQPRLGSLQIFPGFLMCNQGYKSLIQERERMVGKGNQYLLNICYVLGNLPSRSWYLLSTYCVQDTILRVLYLLAFIIILWEIASMFQWGNWGTEHSQQSWVMELTGGEYSDPQSHSGTQAEWGTSCKLYHLKKMWPSQSLGPG